MKKERININVELFKRYAPSKKLEIINALSDVELLSVTQETLLRIVKEAGKNKYRSRDKVLSIVKREAGNAWNSIVENMNTYKGKLYLNIYCQMDSTDTVVSEAYANFIKGDEYKTVCKSYNPHYGTDVPTLVTYNKEAKAKVVKSFLLEYVYTKYEGKLNTEKGEPSRK